MLKNIALVISTYFLSILLMSIAELSLPVFFLFYILLITLFVYFEKGSFTNFTRIKFTIKDFSVILFFLLLLPLANSILNISINESSNQIEHIIKINNSDIIWGIFLAPIFEELFFRKFLLDILEKIKTNYFVSILITSVFFGICHGINSKTIIIICIGITYAYLYLKTKNIILTIILHAINNLSYNLVFFYKTEIIGMILNLTFPLIFLSILKLFHYLFEKRRS